MQKITSPEGEEFEVEVDANTRILNEGLPFIIVDIKERRLSVKEGPHFLFTAIDGNIPADNTGGLGFFDCDTRFLSLFEMRLNGRDPILLTSTAERDYMSHTELTNADIHEGDRILVPQETLNLRRLRVVKDGFYERLRIKNYNPFPVAVGIEVSFGADFADMFEVRGMRRRARGTLLKPKMVDRTLVLAYHGQDDVFRQTRIEFSQEPDEFTTDMHRATVRFDIAIQSHGRHLLQFFVQPVIGTPEPVAANFNSAVSELRQEYEIWEKKCTKFVTDNRLFDSVLERGKSDIRALLTKTKHGSIIDGGIPWYVASFGRDGLISAIETLPLTTYPAAETLRMLAALQGTEEDEWRDEEPGKILHEIRRGELANLREIPHTPYFGSVDSTPLFIVALSEYIKWTNDTILLKELEPNLSAALDWIDKYGMVEGFLVYKSKSKRGLINQGWKDSFNAVMHSSGKLAEPPIALAEVQAYVYYAKRRSADLYEMLGDQKRAANLRLQAAVLKERFNEKFWMEEEGFFCMAIDGDGNQVRSITSNPGQCLFSGIVDDNKAPRVISRLLQPDMFSGWGIRTMSKSAKGYNPMSYHNGSVWPHDNALAIRGIKRYGFSEQANVVAGALFDTATHHAYSRLPELFCGFTRRGANWPVSYPVACSPQAWAAGAMFMIFQSMLGLSPDAPNGTLYINQPTLPPWLNSASVKNLPIGAARLDISFNRDHGVTSFTVMRKEGNLKIIMEE